MKKLTSALLVAAGIASVAAAQASSATGFYAGASAGVANTNVKYSFVSQGVTDTSQATQNNKSEGGKMAGLFGVFAGYGMGFAQGAYVGGEVYGGFDTTKAKPFDDLSTTRTGYHSTTVKRSNFYGVAFRLGYMLTPSTLGYIRLAVESGKWKTTVTPNQNLTASAYASGADQDASKKALNASKSSVSFVPGVGFETFLNKNLFLRAEYTYLFGPKISLNQSAVPYANGYINGTSLKHEVKITQHAFKIGVGYKF